MSESTRVPIEGSYREPVQDATTLGRADSGNEVRLTVQLRLRDPEGLRARIETPGYTPYTREEYLQRHAPTEEAVARVRSFLERSGLTVVDVSPDRRTLTATGTIAAAEQAFGTELYAYESGPDRFHGRSGHLTVPQEVAPHVEGVFGLDRRPFAEPQLVVLGPHQPEAANVPGLTPLTALQVADAYRFPAGDGAGVTIGIVELGGGYRDQDLQQYFAGLGLSTPQVIAVPVNGGSNDPTSNPGANGEVDLDIEVAGAIAPAARIVVYFGRDASEQSFIDVVNAAVNDTTYNPSVVSISWGGPESGATAAGRQAMDSAFQSGASLGITFLAASGDSGAADDPSASTATVDYPAASPFVTGCGGTSLVVSNGAITNEVVWNEEPDHGATGGGISAVYPVPSWQQDVSLPAPAGGTGGSASSGRGVPDVAGNADPYSGYIVQVDGTSEPIGGTSAVAPLWAGLIARLNGAKGRPSGFLNPTLYAAGGRGFNDVTSGDNSAPSVPGYQAGPGWDACTGWGSPDGTTIGTVLA